MALKSLKETPEILFDPIPAPNPQGRLAEFRAQAPLARTNLGIVFALHHRHLDLVAGDATRQIELETKMLQGITSGPIFELTQAGMLFANGETHRRRRAPVARAFAFKLMDAMRPRAAAMTQALIAPHVNGPPVDFVNEIAAQIPARIIAEILGIPESDLPVFMQWIADTSESLGFILPERRARIEASLIAFNAYVGDLLERRRQEPLGDFISDYIATTKDTDLSEIEIRTQLLGLILAGSDTTRGSLCMTLAHLLSHPNQWRAFCANPDGLKKAVVDEGLRFDPVVPAIPRIALRDLDVDGYLVPEGTPIAISLLSALRDPERYAEPDRFNIYRDDHPKWHPIFGVGAHRCLGEALARAELEEAMATIARLAPQSELVGDFPKLDNGAIRQVSGMTLALKA